MTEWLELPEQRQKEILALVSNKTGLPAYAIEKDWWVTLALKGVFQTEWANHIVFKGGTSLSKSWGLIERFSEDIDLVLDRKALGFRGELSKSQLTRLRKVSCHFISESFKDGLHRTLQELGLRPDLFSLDVQATTDTDKDPQILELKYESVLETDRYIKPVVLIEMGARSLREPSSQRHVHSILGTELPEQPFSGSSFSIETVDPSRTFLEKIFLLHEEFSKPTDLIRYERMSRHLYDLDKLMDTEHGLGAMANTDLYRTIVDHRKRFTRIKGIDYSNHVPSKIGLVPPGDVLKYWQQDYKTMQETMIYGDSISFDRLIERMIVLQARLREVAIDSL